MDEQIISSSAEQSLQMMETQGAFEIVPCEGVMDFEDKNRFTKLKLNAAQKSHVSAMLQQMPSAMSAAALSQAYIAKFPEGLPHTLTALRQGGFGSMIRGESGRFVGSASFYSMSASAAIIGAFSAMSIASGQYYLAQINDEMRMMNIKIDEILEFLYGDKKAELMSEMSFVRYAYHNYGSIMTHEQQRLATITNLQEAKKVAMKDIEFYIGDLMHAVSRETKDFADLRSRVDKAFRIKRSLELSQQLYVMSCMMEMYFAQNQDEEYLSDVEREMLAYIDKCDRRVLGAFSELKGRIDHYKPKPMEKVDKSESEQRVGVLIEDLNSGEETAMRKAIRATMHAATQRAEYYMSSDGNVYVKK